METELINLNENSKILIINTAFLGDIALTSFLTQKIKNHYKCDISVLTTKSGAEVLSSIKSIDSLFIIDKKTTHKAMPDTIEFAKGLSSYNFDVIISLHKSYRTSKIVKNIKADVKIGFDTASNARVYTHKVKYLSHKHEVERYFSTIFTEYSLEKVDLEISEDEKLFVENVLVQQKIDDDKQTIVLAPGSVWETKKWGNKKYYNLANILKQKYNVIFIGSTNDCFEVPVGTIDLFGKTNFNQTFHLLSLSHLIVTNDSAPTHFASIINIPTITIFGATHPMFGFGPLADRSLIIRNVDLKCSPCRIHGSDECPLGTHECMTSISSELVADNVDLLLSEIITPTFL